MTTYRLKRQTSTATFPNRWAIILLVIACSIVGHVTVSQAKKAGNVLTIQNDSGQFALVKTVGPTRAVAKLPLDQKKTIHVAPGEYYILVRFGFAPKEYIYTKGDPFSVTQKEKQFSYTTITLHRVISGMDNPHEVSRDEFENYKITKGKKNAEAEKNHKTQE